MKNRILALGMLVTLFAVGIEAAINISTEFGTMTAASIKYDKDGNRESYQASNADVSEEISANRFEVAAGEYTYSAIYMKRAFVKGQPTRRDFKIPTNPKSVFDALADAYTKVEAVK